MQGTPVVFGGCNRQSGQDARAAVAHSRRVAMKILTLSAAALILGLTGAAYAQQAIPKADNSFAQKAAGAGLSEVAEANIAVNKTDNADVKQFAQQMITDHTKANDELTKIAQGKGMTLPTEPPKHDRAQAGKLQNLSGAAFDKRYIADQLTAHKQAVALFTRESKRGKDTDLKQFASETLPTLQHHLEMVQSLAGAK
jgi:putative membrane protein